ncbi:metallophosphoesterase family protein [Nonomuraea solani]|uniref:metallophosphoesterase family protein n=1 Tax=Nonomuraea solani TaxID=1144553 RepID=UPI000CDEFB07|nr:metallophosphoesterase family protein [Nonomuraea solani]
MLRTVIVGDIHGCFDELLELLEKADLHPDDLLVSVGDLVDRGPAPGEVVGLFRERPNSVVVMGNHERKHVRGIFSYAQEITRLQLGDRYAETVEWMRTLPYHFENEHVRVVHAALLPEIAPADQKEEILCGSTSGERELAALFPDSHWHDHYTDAKPVVFGHHVTGHEPMIRDGRIFGLDTGACHGWNLTALSVPDFTIHQVRAHADHWSIAKRRWQLPVLKTKPWYDLTWPELTRMIERFSSAPEAGRWLEAVAGWAAELRSSMPALAAAAHRAAAELAPDELRRHPAASYLFQAREGRLDLVKRCPTPRRTIDLAATLGLPLPELPD